MSYTCEMADCEAEALYLTDGGSWVCKKHHGDEASGDTETAQALSGEDRELLQKVLTADTKALGENIANLQDTIALTTRLVDGVKGGATSLADKLKEIQKQAESTREVVVVNGRKKTKVKGHVHVAFDGLVKLAANRVDAYIWGPPGTGKNHTAKQVSESLGLEYYALQLSAVSMKHELVGSVSPVDGRRYETPFSLSYANGGLFLADELDNWAPSVVTSINSALANGEYSFPWGTVERHKDFVFIGAGNTTGAGATMKHSDRRAMDDASRDRLATLFFDYDAGLEEKLSTNADWLAFVRNFRNENAQHGEQFTVSMRAVLQGQVMLAAGFSMRETVDSVLLRGASAPAWMPVLPEEEYNEVPS